MKHIIYTLLFAFFFGFTACDKDDNLFNQDEDNTPVEITFNMSFEESTSSNPKLKTSTNTDFISSWENGDKIGVYIVKRSAELQPSGNYADNIEFTYNNGTWTTNTPQYYPNTDTNRNLSFYAYYPYDPNMTNPTAYVFSVSTNQSIDTIENYTKSDFLWAKLENVAKSDNAVTLQFSHALAMIEFQNKYYDSDFFLVMPTLEKVVTNCTINLSTKHIAPGGSQNDIKMLFISYSSFGGNVTSICRALVPPQTMDVQFLWDFKGTYYRVNPATNVTLTSGKVNKYEIRY